jgi:flagellar biosynthetic protein FlhB
MAEPQEGEDRTEAATPRRIERAREQGQVAVSTELSALAALGAGALVAVIALPGLTHRLVAELATLLAGLHTLEPRAAMRAAAIAALVVAAPVALAVIAAAVLATMGQTGFIIHSAAISPDLARLSPTRGLSRLLGLSNLANVLKSIAKLAITGWASWHALGHAMPLLGDAPFWSAARLSDETARVVVHLLAAVLAAHAMIALADLGFVRWRHARSLRMSRHDLREEAKEMEGDPQVKGRLKQIRLQRARRRMLAAVPKATVVITNPTHYAIALSYAQGGNGAPRIVAKGVDAMAARIRAVAEEHRVPLVQNPPLARALYPLELDREIPEAFYKPVAEIIAYVWRLRGGKA